MSSSAAAASRACSCRWGMALDCDIAFARLSTSSSKAGSEDIELFRGFGKLGLDKIGRLVQPLGLALAPQRDLSQDCVTPDLVECDALINGIDVGRAAKIGFGPGVITS